VNIIIFRLTAVCLITLLSACGSTEIIKKPNANSYTVSAQYGAMFGGWEKATTEATEKGIAYCENMQQKYQLINEKRSGVIGWSPLVSTITFNCGADTDKLLATIGTECKTELLNTDLDSIRDKVEIFKNLNSAPPFSIATNDSFPSDTDKVAIAKWAKIREGCINKEDVLLANNKQYLSALQNIFFDKEREFNKKISSQLSALIVALYQSKLTYSEFAQKRYEMSSSIASADRDFRAATLMQDRDAQIKAQELAIQQQQNNINTWATYVQSVNNRQSQTYIQPAYSAQPQTIKVQSNCITNKFGNTTTSNCN